MRLKNKWESDSKQYRRYHLKQMIHSVIYGLVIGDALGVPVEFNDRDSYQILNMVGYGTYNQPDGTWSDDTSLSLALIEHLCENSDLNELMDKFVAYRQSYLRHLLGIVLILVLRLIRRLNGIWRENLQRNVEGLVRGIMAMEL